MLAANCRRLLSTLNCLALHGTPLKPKELSCHQLITQSATNNKNYWQFCDDNGNPRTIKVAGDIMADSGDAILSAVLNNGGIAALPN
jgi:DNA-binding transcriptional LysR family regulator